jgi:hypothetical protein
MFSAPRSCRPKSSSGASSFWPLGSYSRPMASSWRLSVDQSEEPPGGQGLSDVAGDCLAGPGLADYGRLGPVIAGGRIFGDDPAVRRGQ